MPWSNTTPMDQKTKLIADHLRGTFSISELCTNYRISRKTPRLLIDLQLAEQLFILFVWSDPEPNDFAITQDSNRSPVDVDSHRVIGSVP